MTRSHLDLESESSSNEILGLYIIYVLSSLLVFFLAPRATKAMGHKTC